MIAVGHAPKAPLGAHVANVGEWVNICKVNGPVAVLAAPHDDATARTFTACAGFVVVYMKAGPCTYME